MAKRTQADDDPRDTARNEALKHLIKAMPGAFRDETESPDLVGVSTGSLAVDYIVGNGGFPRSKLSEIFGAPSSGKSTLAAMACAKAQAAGLYPVYVDIERGLDRKFAQKLGFDVPAALTGQRGLYVTPDTFEEMLLVVEAMATDGLADLIIIDSVQALVPEDAFKKKKITDMGAIGASARLFSASLPKLTKIIDRPGNKTALVFVNQIRANISTGFSPHGAPPTKSGGGWALAHYSSLRIELKQTNKKAKVIERMRVTDKKEVDEIPVASLHMATTIKNKVSLPYRQIQFYIRYDEENNQWGIDNLQTVLSIGEAQNLINRGGGGIFSYTGGEEMKVKGESLMYQWFVERPHEIAAIRTKLGV